MTRLASILFLCVLCGCVTTEVQSLKPKAQSAELQVSSFRLAAQAVIAPPAPKTIRLTWQDSNVGLVTFNVYHSTDLTIPLKQWPLATNVAETSLVWPCSQSQEFFAVTATDGILESDFATQ